MHRLILAALGVVLFALGLAAVEPPTPASEKGRPAANRPPWTTSRFRGAPEPPPPYRIVRAFPNLAFKNPLLMTRMPGSNRLFVGEQAGRIFSFPNDQRVKQADLFVDLPAELKTLDSPRIKSFRDLYGLVFHPKFERNRYCYICYVLNGKENGKELEDGTRVSRFRVTETDPPRLDPASEKIIITWLAGGHNGGDLHFGPDGFLYISTGDATAPNPPDGLDTGQDLSDLLSSILRIDVNREANGRPYAVPPDNPFLDLSGVRPEIWAYGFRNPWRMSFDRQTGELWVGDVGWELWEMIYRVVKGGNYGWSVMEGRQVVRPESRRGLTPIRPPALDFPHTEAASITGGVVYRGKKFPDLAGCYLCGDWVTHKVWATRFEGDRILSHREIARGNERIVTFAQDENQEVYIVHHEEKGTIHELAVNPEPDQSASFPRKLSETGLFDSVAEQRPAPGVVPYRVQVEQWQDHAAAQRWVALPGDSVAELYHRPKAIPGGFFSGQVFFPRDGLLVKTIGINLEQDNPKSRRLIETQVLHYNGETWLGYTYAWNEAQTDALLVPPQGDERQLTIADRHAPGGTRRQAWRYSSRAECLTCHNPWAGPPLGFTPMQLDRDEPAADGSANQLLRLQEQGVVAIKDRPEKRKEDGLARLVSPGDPRVDLASRARSYLHGNCSHCHRFGAGGTADIDLRADIPLKQAKIIGIHPVQGTFEIYGANIVAPGDPYRSTLFYRMAKLGRGRMPHLGSELVDEEGLRLIHDWIAGLAGKTAPAEPLEPARLLTSTQGALRLAYALGRGVFPEPAARDALAAALARPEPHLRDLFERFVPAEARVKRLGSVIRPEQILGLKGDGGRGRALFFQSAGLQCGNCHRFGREGTDLGPDLTDVGKRLGRAQVLESLLDPSRTIEPKYLTYLVETADGQVHTGLLAEKNEREVVLRVVGGKEVRIPVRKVERIAPQHKSLMPELLLRDLTAEQAADLIEFLMTPGSPSPGR